jgi:hypothetical protein
MLAFYVRIYKLLYFKIFYKLFEARSGVLMA